MSPPQTSDRSSQNPHLPIAMQHGHGPLTCDGDESELVSAVEELEEGGETCE